jgi:hypothetical protein
VKVYGVCMVHNEAGTIQGNVLYHLSLGFNRLSIVDNDSTDGTDAVLRRLSQDSRVWWTRSTREAGSFHQGPMFTQLARMLGESLHDLLYVAL